MSEFCGVCIIEFTQIVNPRHKEHHGKKEHHHEEHGKEHHEDHH
jgi:hypothetical protein